MLKFLLEKEFKQFMRNPVMPRMVLIMPLVMMIVFPLATNRQVQDITISIVDNDKSQYSMELVNKITSSGYFILTDYSSNYSNALKSIEKGDAYIILEIEKDFEKNIVKEGSANVIIFTNNCSASNVNILRAGLECLIWVISNIGVGPRCGSSLIPCLMNKVVALRRNDA